MGQTNTIPAISEELPFLLRSTLDVMRQRIEAERVRFTVTPEAQDGGDRDVVLQVIDRVGKAVSGRWLALVYISPSAAGTPGGTQTVVWSGGTVLATLVTDVAFLILTDADGTARATVTLGGAGSRHVGSAVFGDVSIGGEVAWV